MPGKPAAAYRAAFFVVRTPLLPLAELAPLARDHPASPHHLRAFVRRPEIREAIALASPALAARLAAWQEAPDSRGGDAVARALLRYAARMCWRPTPFGLFAGVSIGAAGGRDTALELAGREHYRRRSRLSGRVVADIAAELAKRPEIQPAVVVEPNPAACALPGELRFPERSGDRVVLSSVVLSEVIERALAAARGGARVEEVAARVATADPDIEVADAREFVVQLVEAGVLVSSVAAPATGDDPLEALGAAAGDVETRGALRAVGAALAAADAEGLVWSQQRRRSVELATDRLRAAPAGRPPVDVDLYKPAPGARISDSVLGDVLAAVEVLRRIAPAPPDRLARFRAAFGDRYGDREVPLLEALDDEVGVLGASLAPSPLIAGVPLAGRPAAPQVAWGRAQRHLMRRLAESLSAGTDELLLIDADVDALARADAPALPDAFSVVAQILAGRDDGARVLMWEVWGPAGTRLLGRLAGGSGELCRAVREHVAAEEALDPSAIFAEIAHLPSAEQANLVHRPRLRGYEIPIWGASGAPPERRIPPADLTVAVRGRRVILRSRALGRRVIPRMETAHNHRGSGVPVYRFLCDVRDQDHFGALSWSWGPLASAPFLPRVRYRNLLLRRAEWRLSRDELAPIAAAHRRGDDGAAAAERVAALRRARRLPRWIAIRDEDEELPVDLDSPALVDLFASMCRRPLRAVELVPRPEALAVTGPEGAFNHELVIPFVRCGEPRRSARGGAPAPARPGAGQGGTAPRRRFEPGSEWLYVQIFCAAAAADRVLTGAVVPVVEGALSAGQADSWFFIRYPEPKFHLRVRIRGDAHRLWTTVLGGLRQALAPHLASGRVHDLAVASYERELERYGGDCIERVEALFCADSAAAAAAVAAAGEDPELRWRLALRGAHLLLDDFAIALSTRGRWLRAWRDELAREHGADAAAFRAVGNRFRRERSALAALIAPEPAMLGDAGRALDSRSGRLRPIATALIEAAEQRGWPTLEDLVWSCVHLHVNRLVTDRPRAHELVLFDLLRRLYAARIARQ